MPNQQKKDSFNEGDSNAFEESCIKILAYIINRHERVWMKDGTVGQLLSICKLFFYHSWVMT